MVLEGDFERNLEGAFMVTRKLLSAVMATAAMCGAARGEGIYLAQKPEFCADISGGRMVEGNPIMLWPCHGKGPQQFDYDAGRKSIVARADRSLCVDDIVGQGLALVRCNATRIKWSVDNSAPAIRSQDGRCWDARGGSMVARTRLILWPCHGKANQQFSYY